MAIESYTPEHVSRLLQILNNFTECMQAHSSAFKVECNGDSLIIKFDETCDNFTIRANTTILKVEYVCADTKSKVTEVYRMPTLAAKDLLTSLCQSIIQIHWRGENDVLASDFLKKMQKRCDYDCRE